MSKIRYIKFLIKLKRIIKVKHYSITSMSMEEKSIYLLINKLIKKEKTDILIRPLSDIIHLQSEDKKYYFVIGPGKVKFTNHNYILDTHISDKFFMKIKNMIFSKIEKDRQDIEDRIFSSRLKILSKIRKSI
jgi:hypothetical protein